MKLYERLLKEARKKYDRYIIEPPDKSKASWHLINTKTDKVE
jgi:hypothetical protein